MVAICLLLAVVFLTGVVYQTGDMRTDETVTSLDLDADGDAKFTLELRTIFENDEEREAFDDFASEIEDDPEAEVAEFRESIVPLVERAGDETGREMSAENFEVETRTEPLPVERGVVEYRFDWNGFAEVSEEDREDGRSEIRAGDVLSGYILGDGDALAVRAPDGYFVSSAEPTPDITEDDTEARWRGPRDFSGDQPRVVFTPVTENETANGAETDGVSSIEDDDDQGDEDDTVAGNGEAGWDFPLYVYGVAVVVVLSVAAAVYHNRSTDATATETTAETDAATVAEDEAGTEAEDDGDEPEMTDDELVIKMIEEEDGRMKQKNVVKETGWSEAKVSKLTSRLEDEGEITKIRLGRENILEICDEDEDDEDEGYYPAV